MYYVQVGEKRTEFQRTISHSSTLFFNCNSKKCSNLILRSGLTSLHGRRRKGSREESLCALSCVRLK